MNGAIAPTAPRLRHRVTAQCEGNREKTGGATAPPSLFPIGRRRSRTGTHRGRSRSRSTYLLRRYCAAKAGR
jgi:hypothetical protein